MTKTQYTKQLKSSSESVTEFENRKQDHIQLALGAENEALGGSGLAYIALLHEALPELDFSTISLASTALGCELKTPFLVSSMTAGHEKAPEINMNLAAACADRAWLIGVGSQRRQIEDLQQDQEWSIIKQNFPQLQSLGNIGLAQIITTPVSTIQRLADSVNAKGMIIHCNPLQEVLQSEGTPQFSGGLKAIEQLCQSLDIPVIVKETGCGFSASTLQRLNEAGVSAVDLSGFGGTHWGRIEGKRGNNELKAEAAKTFANWGINTVTSLLNANDSQLDCEVWASGGIRSGLDAAKCLAMGANIVGFAKPILAAALDGPEALNTRMAQYEFELKVALFCTGSATVAALQERNVWYTTQS